ncbi:MAG: peptide ABC transporter permease [delta proteobacterium ML8_F1]|nr:MAG: peptide ABC transporter permease [delta proteobacterium ML8_F1]
MSNQKTDDNRFEPVDMSLHELELISRQSLTYWQDAWRRLKKNHLSMLGLTAIILMTLLALFGPLFSKFSYSDQSLELGNIPPSLEIYRIDDSHYFYMNKEYKLIEATREGEVLSRLIPVEDNIFEKYRLYEIGDKQVKVDYSLAAAASKSEDPNALKFAITVDGQPVEFIDEVRNQTYWFGSDNLGRDLFTRVLYGARISLLIALVATLVNFFIGVIYGGIAGFAGGRVDNLMMRVVDVIATVPLLLYVILLMVIFEPGLKTIMIAIGTVYWVNMARIVRGQILAIKEQEFVLAARTLGASSSRILFRHLIPNTMGPIIVALAMMIPSAIFTEAFLSFIGLGVSAPMASWGTLANDAVSGLRTYPYQLFYPALFISVTVLAFNFLGDGLRDALDPRLRK